MRVIRSELKYYISNFTYHILRNRLKYILKRDRHNLKDGGYFYYGEVWYFGLHY